MVGDSFQGAGIQVTFSQPLKRYLRDGKIKIKEFFEFFSGNNQRYKHKDKTANELNLRSTVGTLAKFIKSEDIKDYKNPNKYPENLGLKFTLITPKKAQAVKERL